MKKLLIIIGVTVGLNTALADWPKKLWEKTEFEHNLGPIKSFQIQAVGKDKSLMVLENNSVKYGADGLTFTSARLFWVSSDGVFYEIVNPENNWLHGELLQHGGNRQALPKVLTVSRNIIYLSSNELMYGDEVDGHEVIIRLQRKKESVVKSTYKFPERESISLRSYSIFFDHHESLLLSVNRDNSKITCWDFTPPSSTAPKPDDGNGGGNGGGNETVNSRLIIKTAGPDIALATDGKLGGAAELQKSNDLRSWRKLVDVPKEAAEILVTPRERGNEFYRLKKK